MIPISKSLLKTYRSLKQSKYRKKLGLFCAEGVKVVEDILKSGLKAEAIIIKSDNKELKDDFSQFSYKEIYSISEKDMNTLTSFKSSSPILAVFKSWDNSFNDKIFDDLSLFLDRIKDPGNLGTIIRTADWFGIKNIICNEDSVELFNPKVIQSTMGSITRVNIYSMDHEVFFTQAPKNLNIYGTLLEGNNIYRENLSQKGIIVIGNESQGISDNVKTHITKPIHIPSFNTSVSKAESLNASIATSIVISEFKRRT